MKEESSGMKGKIYYFRNTGISPRRRAADSREKASRRSAAARGDIPLRQRRKKELQF